MSEIVSEKTCKCEATNDRQIAILLQSTTLVHSSSSSSSSGGVEEDFLRQNNNKRRPTEAAYKMCEAAKTNALAKCRQNNGGT